MFCARINRALRLGQNVVRRQSGLNGAAAASDKTRYFSTTSPTPNIKSSPFPDVDIPKDLNLAHYVIEDFPKFGDRPAFVSKFILMILFTATLAPMQLQYEFQVGFYMYIIGVDRKTDLDLHFLTTKNKHLHVDSPTLSTHSHSSTHKHKHQPFSLSTY